MIWIALLLTATLLAYVFIIRPKLKEFAAVAAIPAKLDAAGATLWQKFKLWLLGKKTWVLGLGGVAVTAAPQIFDELHLIDFTAFFTPDFALKLSGVITLLMTVTHIFGLVTAAKIDPAPTKTE